MATVNKAGPCFDVTPWTHGNCQEVIVQKGRDETTFSYTAMG